MRRSRTRPIRSQQRTPTQPSAHNIGTLIAAQFAESLAPGSPTFEVAGMIVVRSDEGAAPTRGEGALLPDGTTGETEGATVRAGNNPTLHRGDTSITAGSVSP